MNEQRLDDEMRFHLERQIADYIAEGITPEAARRRALIDFGGEAQIKEECREVWSNPAGGLAQDFRYAARMIRKRPAFAAVAIAVLALGIGANSAVFSVVNAVLLRPLAFPDLDRLVEIRAADPRRPGSEIPVAPADYLDWKEHSRSFGGISAYTLHDYDLAGDGGDPQGLVGIQVSADMLRTLKAQPALGRDFDPAADQPGHAQEALLSHGLWRQRFAADPGVIGRTILLDGRPYAVVGVLPPSFDFPYPGVEIWTSLVLSPGQRVDHRNQFVLTAARLRDGVTMAAARAEIDAHAARLAREFPETNAGRGAALVLLRERQGEFSKPFLTLLQGTALFVLLIACANLANLQLAQAMGRRREIAVRAALGAGRWRVVRLLLIESLLLAIAGAVAGAGVGYAGVALLKRGVAPETTRLIMGWSQVALQPPVLAFTLVVAVLAGIAFGLTSALQASRLDLSGALKDGGRQGASKSRLRTALVMAEVTLAVVAVIGASQMVGGFRKMFDVYQGFSPDRILAIRLVLPGDRYDTPHRMAAFYDEAREAMAGLPGAESVAVTSNLPGAMRFPPTAELEIEGRPALSHAEATLASLQTVGPGYFATLKIPIRKGRAIEDQDGENAPPVVVVSERVAARCWPGENPIGKRVRFAGSNTWRTVAGLAGNVHQFWFEKQPPLMVYLPYRQTPRASMYLALRTHGDPAAALPAARERIRRLDASLPLHEPKPMPEVMLESMSAMRLSAGMMTVFGILALLLAAVGVYGVMAYAVTQRHREFGIRIALGARPREVLRMVVWQGFLLTAWGIAAGLAGGFAMSRAMSGIMFGVSAGSLAVLAGAPALLAIVSLAACWIPARTVTRVDPVEALKAE